MKISFDHRHRVTNPGGFLLAVHKGAKGPGQFSFNRLTFHFRIRQPGFLRSRRTS